MSLRRVAVIFDNQVRPDTTGNYCRRALESVVEVRHYSPSDLHLIPRGGFDLCLVIDDGLEYDVPTDLRPAAWWVIDTHLNLEWYLRGASRFDFVFAAQRDGAEQLRNAGIATTWLPLACDPDIHRKRDIAKRFDVCFVGNVFDGERAELLTLIQQQFSNSFVGQRYFHEMAETYSASRTVFNRSIRNDINMRVFEAVACGSLLITNDLRDNGQEELLRDGVHVATYREPEELVDKIKFYLRKDDVREHIAAAGCAEVLHRHTYRHRMQALLDATTRELSKVSVAMPPACPRADVVESTVANEAHSGSADCGVTSIIVLTLNLLPYTQRCLNSVRERTDEPYELIVVDNGSTDGTVEYLRSFPSVKFITNATNRGFPAAVNQGIRAATGRQILLLNNDTVVTTGWLRRLLQALYKQPQIGLVGPCSNCVSGDQQVSVTYGDDLAGLDVFAWQWAQAHEGIREVTDRLVGFCLLLRRELVDRIGCLDEQFGPGCYDDDDFTKRARDAGYQAIIARDAFVHHFGSRTFLAEGIDLGALLRVNERKFSQKWGMEQLSVLEHGAITQPVTNRSFAVRVGANGGLWLVPHTKVASLCMIARDNERTIGAALTSIRPFVGDMIVVDTGSKDRTPEIAASLGARVYHFAWCDDFSAARNESLKYATGDWIFWMDTDDTIDPENGRKLQELAQRDPDPAVFGYVVQVHCPGPDEDGRTNITIVDHVKLFRNLPELRFEGRIHEQILPAISRAGGKTDWTDLFVVHSGYDHSPEGQKRKLARDLRILHLELQERPKHPFTLFNLGMTFADVERFEEASGYLARSIENSSDGETHLRKAYSLLVYCSSRMNRLESAWKTCEVGLRLFPQDTELRFRRAILLHEQGRLQEAATAFHDVLAVREKRHFTSVDRGVAGWKARQNLAAVYIAMGDLEKAEEQWRRIVQEVPHYRYAWQALGEILLQRGKIDELNRLADDLLGQELFPCEGLLLRGLVAEARRDFAGARRELQRAAEQPGAILEPLERLCQLLFEHGPEADAEVAIQRLLERDPENASAYHNLGMIYQRNDRVNEAIVCYRQSLKYRPDTIGVWATLAQALQNIGNATEAISAWHEVLRLIPGEPTAIAAIEQIQRFQDR